METLEIHICLVIKNFYLFISELFVHILIISGNHEYFTGKKQRTINTIDEEIQKIVSKFDNITYLNMNGIIIGRTKFIGCTFWSDVSNISNVTEITMNDYSKIYIDCPGIPGRYIETYNMSGSNRKYIKSDRINLKPKDVVLLHDTMKKWIINQTNQITNKYDSIIILSHHAPSFSMLNSKDIYRHCYASNCDDIFKQPITHWISGHTHYSKSIIINNVLSLSNCMGYPGQNVDGFNSNKHIIFN